MLTHARGVLAATRAVAAGLAVTLAAASSLSAQGSLQVDAAWNSQYQARGLTTTNRPVIQGQAVVAAPWKRATITAGVWLSAEAGRYNRPLRDISENNGQRAGIAEWNYWVEGGASFGALHLTSGALGYIFPNRAGTTSEWNTLELYEGVSLDVPFAPSVTAWHDVHAVRGVYAEFSLAQTVRSVDFGAVVGWNATQTMGRGDNLGFYQQRGMTHVELSAARSLQAGQLVITPSAHVVFAGDRMTRALTPVRDVGTKIWLGTNFAWSRAVGARSRSNAGVAGATVASAADTPSAPPH